MKKLQKDIVNCLIENGTLTTYGINKILRKNIPGIEYALQGLVSNGIILPKDNGKKTVYQVHPFFKDDAAIKKVSGEFTKVLKIIEGSGDPPTIEGYLDILDIILQHVDMKKLS